MREVEFFGESFALNPREDYEWAMMDWAELALGGSVGDLEYLAFVKRFLRIVIREDDWERFDTLRRENRAQTTRDLMPVVVAAFQQASERPTGLPSDSSDGQTITEEKSEPISDSPVVREISRLEKSGRPDRAVYLLEHVPA